MHDARPLGGRLLTLPVLVLLLLVGAAGYVIGERFLYGIGPVTNLSPGYPWGIWVVFDIVIGTAIGCGGFAMALLVYIFNRGQYHPLIRPALLGGLFGYTLAGAAVVIDLGRWWQAYNMVLPWYAQPNSVMLEVGLCVMAYVTVLWIEFSPAILERLGWTSAKKFVERIMFVFVALGCVLPMMHQSSLGSLLLIAETKVSPLWWTPILPVLFLSSALAMGYGVVMFEATLAQRAFRLPSEQALLAKLARVGAAFLGFFIVARFAAIAYAGNLGLLLAGDLRATMVWIEMGLMTFAFIVIAVPALAASQRRLFAASTALLVGGSLYRLDAYLVGYIPAPGYQYFPSVPELMVTVGVVALEILLYLVFVKTLPVLAGAPSDAPRQPVAQAAE
jgi:Ni/Fe-hydrogenase subunit HybB-like protein